MKRGVCRFLGAPQVGNRDRGGGVSGQEMPVALEGCAEEAQSLCPRLCEQ